MRVAVFVILIPALSPPLLAQQTGNCTTPIADAYLDVNNVRARIFNNGGLFYRDGPPVYLVPKADNKLAIFLASFIVAGLNENKLHAAAATYGRWEFGAGPVSDDGSPPNDCSLFDRLYSIRRHDIDVYEQTGIASEDLANWPTGLGAPTLDEDGNPLDLLTLPLTERKDRKIDLMSGERRDMYGDPMIWWIMNDLGNEHKKTGSPPLGIEVHGLAFAAHSYYAAVDGVDSFLVEIGYRKGFLSAIT